MDRTNVCVVGGPQLQNRLLCSYLSESTGAICSAVSHSQFCSAADAIALVLVDYQDASRDSILEDLFQAAPERRADVALFKVPLDTELAPLIAQPQLKGIFHEQAAETQLAEGMQAILDGELWLPRRYMADYLLQTRDSQKLPPRPASEPLTQREWQVLEMLCDGARNNAIAAALGVSPHTVKTHISNIFKKIDASNRLEAVNWARANAGL